MSLLSDILIIMLIAVAAVYFCHRIRIPMIVGFLFTGIIAGPRGLGLIGDMEAVKTLAEVGVVLLLFTIGLEFSFRNLFNIRRVVLLGGSIQVAFTFVVFCLAALRFGLPVREAVLIGFLVGLSSTAIVMKIFQDRAEMDTPHGNTALGILIFQDLIVVPMMLSIPYLAGTAGQEAHAILIFLAELAGISLFVLVCTKWLVPWFFYNVARTRSRELFLLSVIVLCLAVAWLTHMMGLSLALGAFLAGLIVSESEYGEQALGNVLPFKDVFTSFFFVSIGMLFDMGFLLDHPLLIVFTALMVLACKSLTAGLAAVLVGLPLRSAVLVGFSLSQIGEFSFILAAAALQVGLMKDFYYQYFLAVSVLSMLMAPFVINIAPYVADQLQKLPLSRKIKRGSCAHRPGPRAKMKLKDHLIIIGFGLNGRNLARAATIGSIPHVIIEMNPAVVREERKIGTPIFYGDATQEAILLHADVKDARSIAIVINDAAATRRVTELARRLHPGIYILVRTRYVSEIRHLKVLGADEVIPEEFETSVEIFSRILNKYLLPKDEIERLIAEIRQDGYQMFRSLSRDAASCDDLRLCLPDVEISSFRIKKTSPLIGKTLIETEMRKKYGVTLLAINRDSQIMSNPAADFKFLEGDILFVVGQRDRILEVEQLVNGPGMG
ncbi:MAG: cation:proton antiporter [Deltaproteobacteria bacterium]|nr:cation:proton antiporter [Deltaproteobacteria bacterium]